MTATIIIIILIILIIIATAGKQKKTVVTNMSQSNFSSDSREPSVIALDLAYKHFGGTWQSYLNSQVTTFNLPKRFHETIAISLDNLSPEEQKSLLLSFLGVGTKSNSGNAGFSISVGFDNYERLHYATYRLLQSGSFSEASMTTVLRQLAQKREQNKSEGLQKDDNSIIDVTGKVCQIPEQEIDKTEVPYWEHQYVYSYSELNYANFKQRQFYYYYKSKFLDGVYLDLKGNSNYSFILLFDLLEEYGKHKDILKIEQQLENLGHNYPLTKRYLGPFLQRKMREIGEEDKIEILEGKESSIFQTLIDESLLGHRYKKKLNLSKQEFAWLNKFSNPINAFLSIEGSRLATIKLYLACLNTLSEQLDAKGLTITGEIKSLAAWVIDYYKNNNLYYFGAGYNDNYLAKQVEMEVYQTIFQRAENAIRELFGHKRKISAVFLYTDSNIQSQFEARFGELIFNIINEAKSIVGRPDEKTEADLNSQNSSRWKLKFEELENSFNGGNKHDFIEGIYKLEKTNQNNPSIENIFFEASKFISKFDKIAALRFYVTYLYYDLRSAKVDQKQLTKTIQKNLFKTNEQLHGFEKVVADLVNTKNLNVALTEVEKIYEPKRKKIELDSAAIAAVQKQDRGTVEILTEYLRDEFEDEKTKVKTEEINNEEIKLEILEKSTEHTQTNRFTNGIGLNENQANVIKLFADNSFCLATAELDIYCKARGLFRNQLIESINESYYEILDDVLIEEDEEVYTLNETHYKKIARI